VTPWLSSALRFFIFVGVLSRDWEVEGGVAGDFSTGLRTVTTRVTTTGFGAPALSDVAVTGDLSAFFVVLDLEKNEESDAEGRTIVSDIIMDWVKEGLPNQRAVPRHNRHRSRDLRSALSHTSIPFPETHRGWDTKTGPSYSSRRRRGPGRKKVSICVKYRPQVGRRSKRKFPSPEGPVPDRKTKSAEIDAATTQDDGQSVEAEDKKKERKKKRRDAEETATQQVEDTPSE